VAIDIKETFQVRAPIATVWQFMLDPQKVAACMPGAVLEQVVDERTFLGAIKVKIGAITTSYKGKLQLTDVDEAAHSIRMKGEGRETSGGTAKASLASHMKPLPDGGTEVIAEASVDLTGRIMQVGRGMIQGVSHQLFLQFVSAAQAQLELPAASAEPVGSNGASGPAPRAAAAAPAPPQQQAIRIVPLLLAVFRSAILRFFQRLRRRPSV
jgi:carbon monoxide dehydrogenase subunit G